jgi:hypothetical protein
MRVLVAGWFSFENGHATAGDVLAARVVVGWIRARGWTAEVAAAPPFEGDVDWRVVGADRYAAALFVCGPFQRGELERSFLERFRSVPVLGVNLSMLEDLDRWNPFARLWERDSSRAARPDLVFLSAAQPVPVVGVCRVEPYPGALTEEANAAIDELVRSQELAPLEIDTRLDENSGGLRTPAQVESLVARVDVMVTTRLHGAVLALKNGVPVLPIDPEPGGFKLARQAETVGWPVCFVADRLERDALRTALAYCLTAEARRCAQACTERARRLLQTLEPELVEELTLRA